MGVCRRRKPVEEGSRLPDLRDVEAPMSHHNGASSGSLRVCGRGGGLRGGLVLKLSGLGFRGSGLVSLRRYSQGSVCCTCMRH